MRIPVLALDKHVGQNIWAVDLLEYERGWGSRVDETVYFTTEESAKDFADSFNAKNTATEVPDWYMVANTPYQSTLNIKI